MSVPKISREELKAAIDRGDKFALVEALPEQYYLDTHLPGAIRINKDEVEQLAPTLLPDMSARIVTYCANEPCPNSGIVARHLAKLGYTDVSEYEGGKQDWIEAGLPTEQGIVTSA